MKRAFFRKLAILGCARWCSLCNSNGALASTPGALSWEYSIYINIYVIVDSYNLLDELLQDKHTQQQKLIGI